ncbi:MAG: DNA methyltransferase [Candidatus Micrarchaeaceae archaeon]
MADLKLLDQVQFIYELSLAKLELLSLGAEFEVSNDLRCFNLINDDLSDKIIKASSYFKTVGQTPTDYSYIIKANRTRSANQYLTHWIYPYKGKFHPQMVRALLNIIGMQKGDTVLDPFSGSGTTALESQLLGINFIGFDVSPLCVLQGKVKTQSIPAIDEIVKHKDSVFSNLMPSLFSDETDFYKTIQDIEDEGARNFFMLARLLALSDQSKRRRNFEKSFFNNVNLMLDSVKDYKKISEELQLTLGTTNISLADSRKMNLPDNSIDGIVTSPPYSIALDYVKNDAHSLEDLGFNLNEIKEEFIGVHGKNGDKIDLYKSDMEKVYSEMYRVLKSDKYAVVVIGNAVYHGQEIDTVGFTIDYMSKIGFKLEQNILKIIFGLYNVMNKENILIFKK